MDYARVKARLEEQEERQHARDADRRVLGMPHRADPLFNLHSSAGDEPYTVVTRAMFTEDPEGKPLMRPLTGPVQMSEEMETRLSVAGNAGESHAWLTIHEVAELRGVSHDVIYRDVVSKVLAASRVSGRRGSPYRISRDAFIAYLRKLGDPDEYIRSVLVNAKKLLKEKYDNAA